ncbi:hypothetical protein BG011_008117 [Mortierella polycephala]|uniref:Uncharacterized protein n=1 Tax=Mortierella polycephala TaxID=41804 RepID=A0A9P6PRS6_9FUNG|nr:hypothetical protein BG011_008117 [Mortierella polycephala]
MKFQFQSTLFLWAALLVVLCLSSVNAAPIAGEPLATSAEPIAAGDIETRGLGDGTLQIPTDTKVEETNTGNKKNVMCGYRYMAAFYGCM